MQRFIRYVRTINYTVKVSFVQCRIRFSFKISSVIVIRTMDRRLFVFHFVRNFYLDKNLTYLRCVGIRANRRHFSLVTSWCKCAINETRYREQRTSSFNFSRFRKVFTNNKKRPKEVNIAIRFPTLLET